MSHPDSAFFVFDTHAAAESAIRTVGQSGLDSKELSLVGKGYRSEQRPMGLCRQAAARARQIRAWGCSGERDRVDLRRPWLAQVAPAMSALAHRRAPGRWAKSSDGAAVNWWACDMPGLRGEGRQRQIVWALGMLGGSAPLC